MFCYCGHSEKDHDIDIYRHRCLWCGCPVFEQDKERIDVASVDVEQLSLDSLSGMLDSVSI